VSLSFLYSTTADIRLVGPLIRFYAHLVLALRTIGESVPDLAANSILQAYLKVLEMEGSDHLVAAYAACLRQGSGEESYARFLRCKFDRLQERAELIRSNGPKCHTGV
jgi:nuclear pore complex protein Nup107